MDVITNFPFTYGVLSLLRSKACTSTDCPLPDEDISGYYDGVGVAMSVGEDGTYYICCIATAA